MQRAASASCEPSLPHLGILTIRPGKHLCMIFSQAAQKELPGQPLKACQPEGLILRKCLDGEEPQAVCCIDGALIYLQGFGRMGNQGAPGARACWLGSSATSVSPSHVTLLDFCNASFMAVGAQGCIQSPHAPNTC